jgi:isoquinoline 1-oxidoreductase subunit beta
LTRSRKRVAGADDAGRRRFLQHSGALTLGFYLSPTALLSGRALAQAPAAQSTPMVFEPNAFVRIRTDGSVTVIAKYLEMGQGVFTGLATLLAEELDADWNDVFVEGAPADVTRYINSALGMQGTGDSTSMASAWQQMRQAGATARAMLVAAAAQQWNVPIDSITVSNGVVAHLASERRTRFGFLTPAAAALPVPATVTLKDPAQFKLIGSPLLGRKDSRAKTRGSALFTQDLKLPDMLIAVAAHPVRFGASVTSFDATAAKAIPGVVDVVQFPGDAYRPGGVAALAANTWIAKQGRDALQIQWDESQASHAGSDDILARYRSLAQLPAATDTAAASTAAPDPVASTTAAAGTAAPAAPLPVSVARSSGDASVFRSGQLQWVEALYELPYLAHAALEPMNCLVQLTTQDVSIWNGEQLQTADQQAIGKFLGMAPEQVHITPLYAGGSFGRRGNPHADYVLEAVAIAQAAAAAGHRVPIKLVWTREDDMHAGYYRPAFVHAIRAGLDASGALVAWQQRSVGQSVLAGSPFASQISDGVDPSSVEGSAEPYPIANLRIELITPTDVGVPVQWWRAAGHSHTAFATECMIDELACAAGSDPYRFRRGLLASQPRALAVLDLAARRAGWGSPLTANGPQDRRGRGIALHVSFGTCVAEVAEITVGPAGRLQVDRIVCAVDCGMPINPNVIIAQLQGAIAYGLAATLTQAITLVDGVVQQDNFDRYMPLRMAQMPPIEVFIVPSRAAPTGVGDVGTPPIAPAIVNAVFDATGQRIRRLPLAAQVAGVLT